VFIGGKYSGTTPLQGSMEVGQYEVEVKLDGYTALNQNLAISKNGSNEVNFTMRDRSALPVAIGEAYGSGIVFQLTEDGHGLVVALEDLGEVNWNKAKRKCKSYDGGGFADWYLPSIDELQELDKVNDKVNSALSKEGGKKIQRNWYWSSTEFSPANAGIFFFYSGSATNDGKYQMHYVRPVRAF
jgi:hypothetical protein